MFNHFLYDQKLEINFDYTKMNNIVKKIAGIGKSETKSLKLTFVL